LFYVLEGILCDVLSQSGLDAYVLGVAVQLHSRLGGKAMRI